MFYRTDVALYNETLGKRCTLGVAIYTPSDDRLRRITKIALALIIPKHKPVYLPADEKDHGRSKLSKCCKI